MFSEKKAFQIALIISAIAHGSVIFSPYFKFTPSADKFKKTEIIYLKTKEETPPKLKAQPLSKRQALPKIIPPQWQNLIFKYKTSRPLPTIFTKEKVFKKTDDFLTNKPQLSKPDVIAIKKKIALTPVELKRITNPSYISYYQIVREKIRRCAYQNYTSQDIGEVYISFVISSDGTLTQAKIIEEKSAPNTYLKEIALKSLRDASSFPAFPKDLDYPQLSFNVIISFEIE